MAIPPRAPACWRNCAKSAATPIGFLGIRIRPWANELNDAQGRVAVGIAGASITSPSDAYFASARASISPPSSAPANPHIKWTGSDNRGFILLTLTKAQALAEFIPVSLDPLQGFHRRARSGVHLLRR